MRISLKRLAQEIGGDSTTTIKLAKAYCTPSRNVLTAILSPYRVWFDAPMFDELAGKDASGYPAFQTCEISVKKKQAAWAEYLILSAKTPGGGSVFQVLSKPKNPKNAAYAARRSGLPTPWALQSGKLKAAWVEHDCSEAKESGTQNGEGKTASVKGLGGVMYTSERRAKRRANRPQRNRRR